MNTQGQQFFNKRMFQIAVLAALALALMIGAAYFFGTGTRADTEQSVAASPIGSSLTAVRENARSLADYASFGLTAAVDVRPASLAAVGESRLEDYYFRMAKSAAASPAKSGAYFYGDLTAYDLNPSAAADRSASLAAVGESRLEDYYFRMPKSSSAASSASLAALAESRSDRKWDAGLNSSSAAVRSASLADVGHSPSADFYVSSSTSPATDSSASLAAVEERWAPFYAGLDKALKDAGARPSQGASLQERWAPFYAGLDKALKDAGARP